MVSMNSKPNSLQGGRKTGAIEAAIDPEAAWRQVLARDPAAAFFYAVTTTGVFCRPSCTSRRPLRENVRFFRSAERRGLRVSPLQALQADCVRSPLDKVRAHIEANLDRAVPLKELGRVAGLSPFTVQRLFKREMGVSPLNISGRCALARCAARSSKEIP
jgi:AraC family transcriptional regulator of adaptative response/methylated-DNA-[protein]-cysteine methyltransferase